MGGGFGPKPKTEWRVKKGTGDISRGDGGASAGGVGWGGLSGARKNLLKPTSRGLAWEGRGLNMGGVKRGHKAPPVNQDWVWLGKGVVCPTGEPKSAHTS